MTILRTICLLMLSCVACFSADYWVSQSGSGTQSGADSGDCFSLATQNSTWHGGAGDTVHLVGGFTNTLTIGGSGSSGSILTVHFETGANITASSLGNFINVNGNYVTIDGGVNGVIQNTNNGDVYGVVSNSTGIYSQDINNLFVKNLAIINLYVRTNNSPNNPTVIGLFNKWNGGAASHDITMSNCFVHDVGSGYDIDYGPGASNFTLIACTVSNCNWGGNAGDHGATSTCTNLIIANNHLCNWAAWEDAADANHHNGFYAWAESGGSLRGVRYYGNTVGPGFTGSHQSSGLFCSGDIGYVFVYNNIFTNALNESCADGDIFLWQHINNGSNICAFNNTFVGAGNNGNAINIYQGTNGYSVMNNAVSGSFQAGIAYFYDNGTSHIDYNNPYGTSGNIDSINGSGSPISWATWQGLGYDTHGFTNSPLLSSSFIPLTGSPLIAAGTNLSSFFNSDYAGSARPGGLWTIGAYEWLPLFPYAGDRTPHGRMF